MSEFSIPKLHLMFIPSLQLVDVYHENNKRRAYDQRVQEIEHASFTPIVISAVGFGTRSNHFLQKAC